MSSAEFWILIAVQLVTGAFVYGRLTEKVKGHNDSILKLEATTDRIWKNINEHGERIAAVESTLQIKHIKKV